MNTEKLTMSNGEIINAVFVKRFEEIMYDNDNIRFAQDLYYAQNRLFLRKYEYELYPIFSEDGEEWEEHIRSEVEIQILCDYVVIPEYDILLENVIRAEQEKEIAGNDHDADTVYIKND